MSKPRKMASGAKATLTLGCSQDNELVSSTTMQTAQLDPQAQALLNQMSAMSAQAPTPASPLSPEQELAAARLGYPPKTENIVVETVILPLKPGTEEQFRAAYSRAVPILRRQPGYCADRWGKRIEGNSLSYVVMVEWDSLEAHQRFQASPEYQSEFIAPVKPFFAGDIQMFHFEAGKNYPSNASE
jgi:heme-degrading monooxygenase HmoA